MSKTLNKNRAHRRIPVGSFEIGDEEKKSIMSVLDSGRISEGPKAYEFEKKWAEYIGTKYCVLTSSGNGALITALTAMKYLYKLGKKRKVITSPLTYIADASALSVTGFEPVFVDVDSKNFCITPEAIDKHLKSVPDIEKYSAVLPVDLMGYSVRLDEIKEIAEKYNLLVLEDAAEAHGTVYKGNKCGSAADAGIFSFYIAHNIQAGEMGAITTNNYDIYRLARKIKAQGRACDCLICTRSKGYCPLLENYEGTDDFDPRFSHDLIGYNFKVMEFQAALGLVQFNKKDWIIKTRQENVKYLNENLQEFSDLFLFPKYSTEVSYLAYPLVIKQPDIISRKKLRTALDDRGIETRPLFGCIPTQQPAYSFLKSKYKGKLPNADYLGKNGFYIGCHQYLSKDDLKYAVSAFKEAVRGII